MAILTEIHAKHACELFNNTKTFSPIYHLRFNSDLKQLARFFLNLFICARYLFSVFFLVHEFFLVFAQPSPQKFNGPYLIYVDYNHCLETFANYYLQTQVGDSWIYHPRFRTINNYIVAQFAFAQMYVTKARNCMAKSLSTWYCHS